MQMLNSYKPLLFFALFVVFCSCGGKGEPQGLEIKNGEKREIEQRSSIEIDGGQGEIKITLGDITWGQVKITIVGVDNGKKYLRRRLYQGEEGMFQYGNHYYSLKIDAFETHLLTDDEAFVSFHKATKEQYDEDRYKEKERMLDVLNKANAEQDATGNLMLSQFSLPLDIVINENGEIENNHNFAIGSGESLRLSGINDSIQFYVRNIYYIKDIRGKLEITVDFVVKTENKKRFEGFLTQTHDLVFQHENHYFKITFNRIRSGMKIGTTRVIFSIDSITTEEGEQWITEYGDW